MTITKKKPAESSATLVSTEMNGTVCEVLTLAEAAAYLRIGEAEVVDLIHSQNLPGRSTGRDWRFLKSALQQWLSTGTSTPQARKEGQLALAGKYKDDPDLMHICEQAYQRRRGSATEGA